MEEYNGLSLLSGNVAKQFLSICVVTVMVLAIALSYYYQSKKHGYEKSTRLMIVVQEFVYQIKVLINGIMGPKYIFMGPYVLMLGSILLFSNTLTIFTFQEPTSSLSVTLLLAICTWFLTQAFAIRQQRWGYLYGFFAKLKIKNKVVFAIPNPLSVIEKISPLISLSIRLWGNILSGLVITELVYWALENMVVDMPYIGLLLIGGPMIFPAFLLYFSLFTGCIQAYVFINLSLTYWSLAAKEDE